MIRALLTTFLLSLAWPLSAQTSGSESDSSTASGEVESDAAIGENAAPPIEQAGSDDTDLPAGGLETGRPVPASPEGNKGLEDPDASAFAERRQNNSSLLADRQAPAAYPTLDAVDDDGGALDGAATGATLDRKASDVSARALFTALAAQNCRIAARDVAVTLGPQGFDPETVTNTLATLYIEGAASLDSRGSLTLPASLCPPDQPAPSPRERVIGVIRDNGCSVDEDALRAAPGVSDLSDAQLLSILGPMRDSGDIETGTLTATLSPALCEGN